jgi:hypothetical protein
MVAFTNACDYVLVANEGEPDDAYTVDPEGSVSFIDVSTVGDAPPTVVTAGFTGFNGATLPGVRIFGPGATVAMDLEPEFIAVSPDDSTAWVSLQENNALAIVDIASMSVIGIVSLGLKDHGHGEYALDPSNRDDRIHIKRWQTWGMYQPDGLAILEWDGVPYLVSANEGDARDYDGFSEEIRVKDLELDPAVYKPGTQDDDNLGRLNSTTADGDTDGDGLVDMIHSYGARSISIWDAGTGAQTYDSGKDLERRTAQALPAYFNSNNDDNDSFDSRSDDKGPEPEYVAVGEHGGQTYIFVGLERIGGVMVYRVISPRQLKFVQYINNRDFSGDPEADAAGDLAPEGMVFIPASDSPTGVALLVVANEVSGTTTVYAFE